VDEGRRSHPKDARAREDKDDHDCTEAEADRTSNVSEGACARGAVGRRSEETGNVKGNCSVHVESAEEFHLRALPDPCVNLSIHTAPDVRPLPCHRPQCTKDLDWRNEPVPAIPAPPSSADATACTCAAPAYDVGIDPVQGRKQLLQIEMAVVADPALDVRGCTSWLDHPGTGRCDGAPASSVSSGGWPSAPSGLRQA
jgi:hypothetical protein